MKRPAKAGAPKNRPAKAGAPKSRPAKAGAPKSRPAKAGAPKSRPAKAGAPSSRPATGPYPRIYEVVCHIPHGRVATYGQVAAMAGMAGHARQVGYALHALPEGSSVPWHRVINARGEVSLRAEPGWEGYQRFLLEEEDVEFDLAGRVDLDRFRWQSGRLPPRPKAKRARRA